jgi:hypothetical protein
MKVQAQVNYVLNPSFEQYKQCPEDFDEIELANYWNGIDTTWNPITDSSIYTPYCLPEYCNSCSHDMHCCAVPSTESYYQFPRTGNGMVQEGMYWDNSSVIQYSRDYLQGRFSNNLIAGKSYCVTFFVSLEDYSCYAVNNIGAYLDDGSIDTAIVNCSKVQTQYTPQVLIHTIVRDTLNWVMIQGSFIAQGNEKFITIGNFFDNAHTDIFEMEGVYGCGESLYLVDDVSVIESDAVADAGPDAFVSSGSDSAWIGSHEEGLPCKWYVVGNPTPISVYGGFNVHPDVTTQYVMELDLCDNVTFDTVTVFAAPSLTPALSKGAGAIIFPNPAQGSFIVEYARGSTLRIVDVLGKEVLTVVVTSNKQRVDISGLANGVYNVVITDGLSKERTVRRLVKVQ